jgi:hypothetical protein
MLKVKEIASLIQKLCGIQHMPIFHQGSCSTGPSLTYFLLEVRKVVSLPVFRIFRLHDIKYSKRFSHVELLPVLPYIM